MSTISTSFTAVGVSTGLLVVPNQTATYGISGTYAATLVFEKTTDGGQTWTQINEYSTPNATVSATVIEPGTYRWRCTSRTSGTAVATITGNAYQILFPAITNQAGDVVFEVTSDGITTKTVTQSAPVGGLTGFTGSSNTGLGTGAGGNVASGENVAVGKNAAAGVLGSDNVAVGFGALGSSTNVVSRNVAIGATALGNGNVTGSNNVAAGYECLSGVVGGSSNAACGYQAGNEITSGTGNAILGYQGGKSQGNVSNKFMVGLGNGQGLIFSIDEAGNLLNIAVRYTDGTMKAIAPIALV